MYIREEDKNISRNNWKEKNKKNRPKHTIREKRQEQEEKTRMVMEKVLNKSRIQKKDFDRENSDFHIDSIENNDESEKDGSNVEFKIPHKEIKISWEKNINKKKWRSSSFDDNQEINNDKSHINPSDEFPLFKNTFSSELPHISI